jgi:hypothetical protein
MAPISSSRWLSSSTRKVRRHLSMQVARDGGEELLHLAGGDARVRQHEHALVGRDGREQGEAVRGLRERVLLERGPNAAWCSRATVASSAMA